MSSWWGHAAHQHTHKGQAAEEESACGDESPAMVGCNGQDPRPPPPKSTKSAQ
jgi:hypothetical protein